MCVSELCVCLWFCGVCVCVFMCMLHLCVCVGCMGVSKCLHALYGVCLFVFVYVCVLC